MTTLNDTPQEIFDEIREEYEKTLIIPKKKPSPQWMLMPIGLIGAGKTTVVKPLAERLGLIRISADDVRERLKGRGYGYEGCLDIVTALGKKYLGLGYSVVFDANNGSASGLERSRTIHEAFPEVRQLFIHINPPDEFIIAKLQKYPHTWLFKDGAHAVEAFKNNKETFVLPGVPFVYTFDTSKRNLPEQIEQGIVVIEEVLSRQ